MTHTHCDRCGQITNVPIKVMLSLPIHSHESDKDLCMDCAIALMLWITSFVPTAPKTP